METRATPRPTPRQLCEVLFEDRGNRYHCRLCPRSRAKPRNGGYTSILDHLERSHCGVYLDEYFALAGRPNTLDGFVRVTVDENVMNRYHWMDWVVMDHHELSFCEKKRSRKYTSLSPISRFQLKNDLAAVEMAVRARIRHQLADRPFGLLIDAWTEAGRHYAAIIAVSPAAGDSTVGEKTLLVFSPFVDEGDMSTDSFIELLDYTLDTYRLSVRYLMFYVCDHASVNKSLASRTSVPMIGCASHRLQLGVQWHLEPYQQLLEKVHDLMVKLSTIKNRHALREAGALMPVIDNDTRWSSTFGMLHRYFEINEYIDHSNRKLLDVLLTPMEDAELEAIFEEMKALESVNKRLQAGGVDERELSLLEVRKLFDAVISKFPETAKYLSPSSTNVVKAPHFENGVVKVLSGKESALKQQEKAALSRLKCTGGNDEVDEEQVSFADRVLRESVKPRRSQYIDLRWIPSTSNEVERLFSRAGLVFSMNRRAMSPTTLETLLFLEYNRSLWDPQLVASAVNRDDRNTRQRVI